MRCNDDKSSLNKLKSLKVAKSKDDDAGCGVMVCMIVCVSVCV